MASVSTAADTHAELLMEGSGLKTYRQKMLAEKQQHDWEMKLLEKERQIAWNSDRVEHGRLLSRLEKINKRILEINKENSRRQNLQTGAILLLDNDTRSRGDLTHNERKMSSQKPGNNKTKTFISNRQFLSSALSGVNVDSGQALQTAVPGCHLPLVSQKTTTKDRRAYNDSSFGESELVNSKNLPSIKKGNHNLGSSETTVPEKAKDSIKPRIVRRKSMDPQLLASLLNVDESLVQKQNQVFQRARLNSDAALRVNCADGTPEKSEVNGRKKRFQRRASIASMHMPSDLLKIGFPELRTGAQLSRRGASDEDFPASRSFVSRARRSSLPSVPTTDHGKFANLGLTATRRMSVGSIPRMKTSSLDKLDNVLEES
ncbi:hypothetical protein Bbelb_071670 [Branchiostoma belcheri]|nr:hypothetical protein Bbelb_071670 [Branchiostoma belcheri]